MLKLIGLGAVVYVGWTIGLIQLVLAVCATTLAFVATL